MNPNNIRTVRVAAKGSKKGWVQVTGELPPALIETLDADASLGDSRSAKVYEIIRAHYDRAA